MQQIGAAHGKRIEPELARHAVEQTFERVPRVDRAVAAHGATGRQIGVDAVAVVFHRRYIVEALQQRAGIENGDDAVTGISAAALHHLAFAGGHAPIFVHAELQPDIGLRTGAVGDEGFLAGELHQHLAGGGAGEQRGDDLEIQRLDAGAETAADERLDHADARGIHLQALRQHEVQVIADLRHRLHREAAGRRIEFGKTRVRLDLRVVDLGAAEPLLAHQIGRGQTLADVAELVVDVAFDIAGLVVVQKHGVRRACRFRRVISGQFLDLELDQTECPFGRLGVDGGDRRHRLAPVAHAATGQRIFVHGDRQHAVSVRAVVAGDDRDDAIERAGLARRRAGVCRRG